MTEQALTPTTPGAPATILSDQDARALADLLDKHGKSAATRRAYRATLAEFDAWRASNGYQADAAGIAAYLLALDTAGAHTATIRRKLAALRFVHEPARSRAVTETMGAITRKRADALTDATVTGRRGNASKGKAQLTLEQLRTICARPPGTLAEIRDRAVLLVGFWLAARRSELVALNVEDIEWTQGGALVHVVRSKTDQAGEGATKPLTSLANGNREVCPIVALRAWLDAGRVTSGPLFVGILRDKPTRKRITAQVVALIVKRECERAGIDARAMAGHSLRSGFITAARQLGIPDATIKAVSGHKTDKMLDHYDKRDARDALRVIRRAVRDGLVREADAEDDE